MTFRLIDQSVDFLSKPSSQTRSHYGEQEEEQEDYMDSDDEMQEQTEEDEVWKNESKLKYQALVRLCERLTEGLETN